MGLANVDPAFVTQAGVSAAQRCVLSGVPGTVQIPTAKRYVAAYRAAFKTAPGPITIDPKTGNRTNVPVYILEVNDRGVLVISKQLTMSS